MATRRSESSTRRKEEILDWLERNFCDYVKNYVSAVKEGIRAASPETADELFHSAVAFFSQDLPEPTCQARDGQTKYGEGDIGEEMSALKDKVNALEKRVQENKIEGQKTCSFLELQIDVSADSMRNDFQNLNRKLESLKNQVKAIELETKKSTKDAAATTPSAAVVTSPPTGASATELSRPLKKVKLWTDFSAKVASDRHHPEITDVQLLPCGMFLLADYTNRRVKLFETQGQPLHTMECRSNPRCLALLDSSGTSNSYTAALTLPHCPSIDILEVADNNIKVKRTLQTSRQYDAVAAVNQETLAVADWNAPGIDLINLKGQVLRQICSSVQPRYMDITGNGDLVCSTSDNTITRVQVDTDTVIFHNSVLQIKKPWGVDVASDGSILVTDRSNNTLHLVSSQGAWTKQLWSVPRDRDKDDKLWIVSTDERMCVCVTEKGSVYIFVCLD